MAQKYLIVSHCEVSDERIKQVQPINRVISNVDQYFEPILIKEGQTPKEAILDFFDNASVDKFIPDIHEVECYVSGIRTNIITGEVKNDGDMLRFDIFFHIIKTYKLIGEVEENKKRIVIRCIDIDDKFIPEFDSVPIEDGQTPEEALYKYHDEDFGYDNRYGCNASKIFRWNSASVLYGHDDNEDYIRDGNAIHHKVWVGLQKPYYYTFRVEDRDD